MVILVGVEGCPKGGRAMPKMTIEVPEQFEEVGKVMAEHLAMLQRTADRLGGGKAVNYAAVEAEIARGASKTELAAHRAILQSLDIDVPAVVVTAGIKQQHFRRFCSSKKQTHWRGRGTYST